MKNSTNTNLLILDEIFDPSLDNAGTDDFLKILNTFDKQNVFVISHKQDMLFDKFRNIIQFKKEKNFSKDGIMDKSERFYELLEEMKKTHNAKRHDYASVEDVFANFRTCEMGGIPAWKGCCVRLETSSVASWVSQRKNYLK